MVSIQLDIIKFLLIYRHLQNDYGFKREVSIAACSTIDRPSHCHPCQETSNAESPTPVHVYSQYPHDGRQASLPVSMEDGI